MRIENWLAESARKFGSKTALITPQRRLTYAEFDDSSTRLAAALAARGVERGDRVLVFMDNCWEAVVSIFAILKAGAVFSPINPSTKADKLASCSQLPRRRHPDPGSLPVVAEARQAPSVAAHGDRDGSRVPRPAGMGRRLRGLSRPRAIAGSPPGHRHRPRHAHLHLGLDRLPEGRDDDAPNIVAAATSITTYLENTPDDIILNVLPISFDYGLYQVLMAVKLGATLVLEKSFAFPQAIFDRMRDGEGHRLAAGADHGGADPADERPEARRVLPHLRYITNTAAALPPAHIARLQELFPGARLYSMYGLTECKRCTYLPPAELDRRPGSVGIAIPGTEAYVVDDDGTRVRPGVVGELVIRGPHVMKGYWENRDRDRRGAAPGPYPWEKVLHTGDLFRTDDEGFLYFVGRKDDIIKTRGEKVAPKEVENVLYALPAIREAAVVGVPDPILGLAIKAIVALGPRPTLTEREVIRHCAQHLEDFMVPKTVEFRDELPKTDTGKISRRLVRRNLGACRMTTEARS